MLRLGTVVMPNHNPNRQVTEVSAQTLKLNAAAIKTLVDRSLASSQPVSQPSFLYEYG